MSTDTIRYDGKTIIITGGAGGLGRAFARLLGSRGANLVINDLGSSVTGEGADTSAAEKFAEELKADGINAVANHDTVTTMDGAQAIVQAGVEAFGSVHGVINNAGILRDVSFAKMTEDDWDAVHSVHMRGAFCMSKAVWERFREQNYGRLVMVSSHAGLFGNFGQANYSAAKMGLVGLGQTLAQEGAKYNVRTNMIAPLGASRMTETILPPEVLAQLKPEYVAQVIGYLCSEGCEANGDVFEVGAGRVFRLKWQRSAGLNAGENLSPEAIRDQWNDLIQPKEPLTTLGIQEIMTAFLS